MGKKPSLLTQKEIKVLKEYLHELDILTRQEPETLSVDAWDVINKEISQTGQVPREYHQRIGVSVVVDKTSGAELPTYYDLVWEEWNKKVVLLNSKYSDIVRKALNRVLRDNDMISKAWDDEENGTTQVTDLISAFLEAITINKPQNLLESPFLPMMNGPLSSDIMKLSTKGLKPDSFTKNATIITDEGRKITIERFDKLLGILSTPSKKLLDTALLYLSKANFNHSKDGNISPTVEIPFIEYGEACNYQLTPQIMETPEEQAAEDKRVAERIKELKKNIRRDLHDISSILWSGEETKGKIAGDYKEMRIISSHSISKGVIRINFDFDAAKYFVNAFIMQYPTALLKHDNRKPNAYVIGRKLAFHNSNNNNVSAGTNNTLSVKSLLAAAPEIPTIEDITNRGQRNWKDKIKRPLESALDENIRVGLLSKWEYRDPSSGKTFNSQTSHNMTWVQYTRLMVDFIMIAAPSNEERKPARLRAAPSNQ